MANIRAAEDAKMSSLFHSQHSFNERKCERAMSSSALGRAGGQAPNPVPVIIADTSKETAVVTAINHALHVGSLNKLHKAWADWVGPGNGDVPLSNREVNMVRQKAVRIGVFHLRTAMQSGDAARIRKSVQAVDTAMERWPCPLGIKASLEYQAARQQLAAESEDQTLVDTPTADGDASEDDAEFAW